jgi:serine/threonine protein kinase
MAIQVVTNTSNITHSFDIIFKPAKGEELSPRDKEFRGKLEVIQKAVGKYSTKKNKTMPWHEQALKSAMERHMGHGVVWVLEKSKVVPLSGFTGEGGYGKVRKVRIDGFDGIPSYIEFAGKFSKAKTPKESRFERSVEALVCPLSHPGVIKFWAIHSETMEAYTLWWNGDCIRKFLTINSRVTEATDNDEILKHPGYNMEDLQKIKVFRINRAKLAWALIYIMDRVHKTKVLHNDISPSDVMLHFPSDKVDEVYIGVCDWGMASRTFEDTPSNFGYQTVEKMEEDKSHRRWVAPELFYVFGPPNSDTSLDRMKREHLYTKEADAYSVGKLAQKIWNEENDKDLFGDWSGEQIFGSKLKALTIENPKTRASLANVVQVLTAPPFNFKAPECCFRHEI